MISSSEVARSLATLLRRAGPASGAGPESVRFRRVTIDSRRTQRGDLFIALRGEHQDGHEFIEEAIARGAAGVIAQSLPSGLPDGVLTFVVPDTLEALQRLAAARRRASRVRVIAVTGSVGKTTTKEIAAAVLSRRYPVLKNETNYNNEIGLPLTLTELRPRYRVAVLEMGMYSRGEIRLLCDIAQPHVGVVMNVGPSHLARLGSIEAIAAAKAELPESLPATGVAILNGDDERVSAMTGCTAARTLLFGTSRRCQIRGEDVESHALEGIAFTLRRGQASVRVRTALPGRHMLHNALAAAAVGLTEGMTLSEVAEALAETRAPLRLQVHAGRGGATILDDTYNASPSSMMAALDLLAELPGRRIALLGDMRELGDMEEQGHLAVGQRAAEVADIICVVGDMARFIGQAAVAAGHRNVVFCSRKDQAARDIGRRMKAGDVVLLKASRAMALESVLPALKE